ncbi:hypothetical protein HMPREF3121_05545 [Corynebacterium sp. HMSC11E11]|nr:hypothetical protein HMPREF3121_05545 [Corynebacterium sp. HMSC11E11]
MTQADVAIKASVSARSVHNLESGATWPQAANRERIEQALGWAPGSLETIRDGGEPTELDGDGPSQSKSLFPGGTADAKRIINGTAEAMHRPGTTLGDLDETTRAFFDRVTQLATINGLVGAVENPEHPQALAAIRASLRENIGRHGVTPDLVRTVAAGHLGDVVSQLDAPRRDQVVELAYRLLDEQESEGGGASSFEDLDEEVNAVPDLGVTSDGQVWERDRHGNWAAVRTIKMESRGVIWVGRRSAFMPADTVTSRFGDITIVDKKVLRELLREAGSRAIKPESIAAAALQSTSSVRDDLAARRDSNTPRGPVRNVVDDDDPTAGIDWRDYAAHPKTDPLEEDNPTP